MKALRFLWIIVNPISFLIGVACREVSFDKLYLSGLLKLEGNVSKGAEIRSCCVKEHLWGTQTGLDGRGRMYGGVSLFSLYYILLY